MLRDGLELHDLGDQYFVQHDKARLTNRLLQRLRDLGVQVEVKGRDQLGDPSSFFLVDRIAR